VGTPKRKLMSNEEKERAPKVGEEKWALPVSSKTPSAVVEKGKRERKLAGRFSNKIGVRLGDPPPNPPQPPPRGTKRPRKRRLGLGGL